MTSPVAGDGIDLETMLAVMGDGDVRAGRLGNHFAWVDGPPVRVMEQRLVDAGALQCARAGFGGLSTTVTLSFGVRLQIRRRLGRVTTALLLLRNPDVDLRQVTEYEDLPPGGLIPQGPVEEIAVSVICDMFTEGDADGVPPQSVQEAIEWSGGRDRVMEAARLACR
jgi:hypothetical protein